MAAPAQPTLYLVDGHALAYRTYFALTSSGFSGTTRSGEPTAGVYGFTSVLLRLLEQEQPDYIAVSFDLGKTFRDELFPDYKVTRDKMPDDLRTQLERIREVVLAFDIPIFEMDPGHARRLQPDDDWRQHQQRLAGDVQIGRAHV